MKVLAENATMSQDYIILILLLDMSKAFDTVNRNYLMEQYSDDMSFIQSQLAKINSIKRVVPDMLREADLIENSSKREEYEVSRSGNENWKSCKYPGLLLDSENDIGRRKCLALDAVTTLTEPPIQKPKFIRSN